MMPLLPFIAGLFAGAAAVSALRSERARSVMNDTGARLRSAVSEAESGVRAAARSGLDRLRRASPDTATAPAEAPAPAEKATPETAPAQETKPARKPARARKRASPPAAEAAAAAAKPKRAPRKPKAKATEA